MLLRIYPREGVSERSIWFNCPNGISKFRGRGSPNQLATGPVYDIPTVSIRGFVEPEIFSQNFY